MTHSPSKTIALAVIASGVLALSTTAVAAQAPEPARSIDAASFFTGRWYEIGRDPQKLTDGCVAGTTDYLNDGKGGLLDRDACHAGSPAGKEKVIGGPLTILNPGQNTKVQVSYRLFGFVPIARTYWILDHGDGWFIQADPTLAHINIYTRDPRPPAAQVAELTAKVKSFGYDPAKLEFPAMFPPGQK
jgi:apolipoprotein D and lipocalin family protein